MITPWRRRCLGSRKIIVLGCLWRQETEPPASVNIRNELQDQLIWVLSVIRKPGSCLCSAILQRGFIARLGKMGAHSDTMHMLCPAPHCPSASASLSSPCPLSRTCPLLFTHAGGLLPRASLLRSPPPEVLWTCPPGALISPSGPYLNITFSARSALTTLFKMGTNCLSGLPFLRSM